jgi:flotillin
MTGLIVAAAALLLLLAVLAALFRAMWRVAEPNEGLIISGLRSHAPDDDTDVEESLGFKIVTGKGTFVIPGVQRVRRLSLDLHETEMVIECVTIQGIPLRVKGVAIFKVGDDYASIANAARRFLDQQDKMEAKVHNVFAGHLRSIVGSMKVEEMIRERERMTEETREHASPEMAKLGLIIDSLQIQEIGDPTGYIENLARPHAASVAKDAKIASAEAEREATERQQAATTLAAAATREADIKKAGYAAEVAEAQARSAQAGPLADARAQQDVVVESTRVAELRAQQTEQELQATVRRPADAEAYQQVTLAEAQRQARIKAAEAKAREVELGAAAESDRIARVGAAEADAKRAHGEAEGASIRARGLAEADSIAKRAEALARESEAVIGQQIAERLPQIVEAAANALGNVEHLTVLNGAQGLGEVMTQVVGQGSAIYKAAREMIGEQVPKASENGKVPVS